MASIVRIQFLRHSLRLWNTFFLPRPLRQALLGFQGALFLPMVFIIDSSLRKRATMTTFAAQVGFWRLYDFARQFQVPTNRITGILNGQRAAPRAFLRDQCRIPAEPAETAPSGSDQDACNWERALRGWVHGLALLALASMDAVDRLFRAQWSNFILQYGHIFSQGGAMPIAVRELKASLSRILLRAQGGEIIEVTSHNKPIARIVGIPPNAVEGLGGLIAGGSLSWSGGKPQLEPATDLPTRGTPVSRMVLEDRG